VTIASRPSVWDGMALNVPLICGRDQSRRDATFQHDGQISNGPATAPSSEKFF
jgi:hypothetical protein